MDKKQEALSWFKNHFSKCADCNKAYDFTCSGANASKCNAYKEAIVALSKEIEESRLNGPIVDFDRERCSRLLGQEIEKQDGILRGNADYATSYHVGIKSGLNLAWNIIESCIEKKENENNGE